jgi:hypothetical protein
MKAFVHLLTVLLLAAFSTSAFAKVGPGSLEDQLSFRRFCVSDVPVTAAGDTTTGINGVVVSVSANVGHHTRTSTIGTLPIPAKLSYALVDGGTNATLTCTSLTIEGRDQFGRKAAHVDSTVTESVETTEVVFGEVTAVRVSGCDLAVHDAADIFRVYISRQIGLGGTVPLAQIRSACIVDASTSNDVKCAAINDGTAADIQSALDLSLCTSASGTSANFGNACAYALDTSVAMFGVGAKVALADGDSLCWTIKQ